MSGHQRIDYRRGMSYAEFTAMVDQMHADAAMPVPEPEPDPCLHPYERLVTNIRGKRAHTPGGVLVIVEFNCGDCDAYLGMAKKGFRV